MHVNNEIGVQQPASKVRHRDRHAQHDEHEQRAGEDHHEPVLGAVEDDAAVVEEGALHRLKRLDAQRGERRVHAREEEQQDYTKRCSTTLESSGLFEKSYTPSPRLPLRPWGSF